MQYVPVVSAAGQPLMPCHPARARELVRQGKARRRFDRGLFYLQLTVRETGAVQPIAIGIDPGSKREGITVKSAAHTYLNLQAEAVAWISEAEQTSTRMRRARRYRKTPYRQCRPNRRAGQWKLPPSTRARWGWKMRLCTWLARYYPVTVFIVEDVAAQTRPGKRRWNQSFSPLEVGKAWFYTQLSHLAPVQTRQGYESKALRDSLGLKKSSNKLSDSFHAHCVDSWVLANAVVGGHTVPDCTAILHIVPLRFHRRQLYRLQPDKGGVRKPYGGSRSLGFKRGSWVNHPKYGTCYVGGSSAGRLSLHDLQTGKRLCQNARPHDLSFLCTASWRIRKGERASSAAFRWQSPR
jgi:hypothetical protein